MKLVEILRSKWHLFKKVLLIRAYRNSSTTIINTAQDESTSSETLKRQQDTFETQTLDNFQPHASKPPQYKKASLFPDAKTNKAALSLVMRGVAEVLSQKMNLPWTEASDTLSYEQVHSGNGKICYYIDNPQTPQPDTLAAVAAQTVIDQFDPRACAIHLIYCALVANLDKPWEQSFIIDDKKLLEYTGLVRRRDLCKHQQLSILYELLRQPAQILAHVVWPKQGKVGAFTVADLKIWDITVLRDYQTDKTGNTKLVGLKVIGKAGAWAKYFLNKSEYYHHTGIITKKTVQKLFSIGKQNIGAARMLVWLTFQIQPGTQESVTSKTLMEIAYGADKVSLVKQDRQLRRQMADDFETDLKVVKDAGWHVELNQGSIWLKTDNPTKRPIGYWNELLNTKLQITLPTEVTEYLDLPEHTANNIEHTPKQPPAGNIIREARKAKGWSRAFFAQTMGKSISWVDAIEIGHRQVSQKDLPKLIEELELNTHDDPP
jgi:Helix-turn-helix